jgi:hypothetical protein
MRHKTFEGRVDGLEKRLQATADARYRPINPDDLAILEELEDMIGGPEDPGPPRGPEFLELAIARVLERRGRSTTEIAEEVVRWRAGLKLWGEG